MMTRCCPAGILLALAARGLLALGAHECASGTIAFDTRMGSAATVAQATAFDSFDRRGAVSAAISFSSVRPKETLILLR